MIFEQSNRAAAGRSAGGARGGHDVPRVHACVRRRPAGRPSAAGSGHGSASTRSTTSTRSGTIFFLIAGFGWGKPVMVNGYALRSGPDRDGLRRGCRSARQPGGGDRRLAVGFRAAELSGVLGGPGDFVWEALLWVVQFNVILGLFNLLPVPPLDGYNLVLPFLPLRTAYAIQRYAPVRRDHPARARAAAAAGRRRQSARLALRSARRPSPASSTGA